MAIYDKIRDEKLQYNINREAAKISTLSFGKTDKYEYLKDEEILPSDQKRVTERANFTYFPLGKSLEKQRKTIENQGIKQVIALKSLKPEILKNEDIKKIEGKINQKDLIYRAGKDKYDF